ncbi:MAG: TcpQ domain-containing protein [Pseudomonadota bacterium]|nr:TcpQ domain-containing protein [Pseudomonadota bacterium]
MKKQLIALTFLLTPLCAQSGYEVVDSLNYGIDWKKSEAGTADSDVIEGYAKNVPLSLALKQVIPEGWNVLFSDSVSKGQIVSWRGDRPWAKVMKQLADQANLYVEIQPDGHKVLISKSSQSNKLGTVVHKSGFADPKTYTMESKVWQLRSGHLLSEELDRWAKSVGWSVYWGLERDYVIENPVAFTGTLTNSIKKLIRSYQEQRVMSRVYVKEHALNKVIFITKSDK